MKTTAIAGVVGALLLCAMMAMAADDMPEMPKPQEEHAWLQKLVGEWTSEGTMYMMPGEPPMKCSGTESVHALGGFWVVTDMTSVMPGTEEQMKGMLTLGYDPAQKKYLGTWVDSMTSTLWVYDGTMNEEGTVLTLETEGPCPMNEGTIMQFREVIEIKSDTERTFTSYIQGEDDEWTKMMEIVYTRKA
jgi:hypothetical protein